MDIVVSVKSIDTDAVSYQSISTFERTLNKYADQLNEFEFSGKDRTKFADRLEISLPTGSPSMRYLDIVVPKKYSLSDAHGQALKRVMCRNILDSDAGAPVRVHFTDVKKGGKPFTAWNQGVFNRSNCR